jgi:2-polyprenyl-3-methyl-5-hydroxy-6-metoxy-1,4-benzoquinol methylase
MPATRQVQREWLDELPANDPRAIRSRRDLIRVNTWMMQAGVMTHALLTHSTKKPRTILDLGSGDGTFMLRVARLLSPQWSGVTVVMLDRQDIVSKATGDEFSTLRWSAQTITGELFDVLDRPGLPNFDAVIANLFLHHFAQPQLARLLSRVAAMAPLFVACEPRRNALPLLASRLLWVIGCNDVSRHDATISVRAGFAGSELSALWPDRGRWELHERAARPFTHCFVARRAQQGP